MRNNKIILVGLILMFGQYLANVIITTPIYLLSKCDYNPEIGGSCLIGVTDYSSVINFLYAFMWTGVITFPIGIVVTIIGIIIKFKK